MTRSRVKKCLFAIVALGAIGIGSASCNGTTGDQLISFSAYASGVQGASDPFVVGDYTIQLTSAMMRIGAVYVDESISTEANDTNCINPGIYNAQVPGGIEVDLLNPSPQEFSVFGNGTADRGLSWELWLTDGDINETNTAHIVDLQGTATRKSDGQVFSFGSVITINGNRLIPSSDPSRPGLNPICKQRIIQITGIDVPFFPGGTLNVTVDPRAWFSLNLDFSMLPPITDPNCQLDPSVDFGTAQYCIPDTNIATGLGASQGQEFFQEFKTAGPAAYVINYSK